MQALGRQASIRAVDAGLVRNIPLTLQFLGGGLAGGGSSFAASQTSLRFTPLASPISISCQAAVTVAV